MRHFVPGQRTKILVTVVAASIPLSPLRGAEGATAIPDLSGYWGRDSLHLELPLSGPGPVVNMMHTAAGIMDMSKLMGDYTNPILKPGAAAILKQRGEQSL